MQLRLQFRGAQQTPVLQTPRHLAQTLGDQGNVRVRRFLGHIAEARIQRCQCSDGLVTGLPGGQCPVRVGQVVRQGTALRRHGLGGGLRWQAGVEIAGRPLFTNLRLARVQHPPLTSGIQHLVHALDGRIHAIEPATARRTAAGLRQGLNLLIQGVGGVDDLLKTAQLRTGAHGLQGPQGLLAMGHLIGCIAPRRHRLLGVGQQVGGLVRHDDGQAALLPGTGDLGGQGGNALVGPQNQGRQVGGFTCQHLAQGRRAVLEHRQVLGAHRGFANPQRFGQALKTAGQFGHFDLRHRGRAATQGVQRTHQRLTGDRSPPILLRCQGGVDGIEAGHAVFAKHPVDRRVSLGRHAARLAARQTVGPFDQRLAIRRGLGGLERQHDLRHLVHDLGNRVDDFAVHRARPVQADIQQQLVGPGQVAEFAGTHHAPTALERVEAAANGRQRIPVAVVVRQLGQLRLELGQHLGGLLHEGFADLGVHLVHGVAGGGRLNRGVLIVGIGPRRGGLLLRHRFEAIQQIVQGVEVMLGVGEVLLHALQVAFDAGNGLGKHVGQLGVTAQLIEGVLPHEQAQAPHLQRGPLRLQDVQHRMHLAQHLGGRGRQTGFAVLNELCHQFLELRHVHQRFAQGGQRTVLAVTLHGQFAGQDFGTVGDLVRIGHASEQGLFQGRLDEQHRAGDIHPARRGVVAGVQGAQYIGLLHGDACQRVQAQHAQGVPGTLEHHQGVVEARRIALARAHDQVDVVLDLAQFIAHFFHDPVQHDRGRPPQPAAQMVQALLGAQQAVAAQCIAECACAAPVGGAGTHVVGQLPSHQPHGFVVDAGLALVGHGLQLLARLPHEAFDVQGFVQLEREQRFDGGGEAGEQQARGRHPGPRFQVLGDLADALQAVAARLPLHPGHQGLLQGRQQGCDGGLQCLGVGVGVGGARIGRIHRQQVSGKQRRLA